MADWIQSNLKKGSIPKCPLCQIRIDPKNVIKDLMAFNLVSELKVYCSNKDNGCEWTGELSDLDSHWKNYCKFVEVIENKKPEQMRKKTNAFAVKKASSSVNKKRKTLPTITKEEQK
jgi:hypothetical protein